MKKMMMPAVSLAALAAATAMPSAVVGTPRMEAAGGVEALLKQLQQELNRVGDDVRRAGEDALKQQTKNGEVTAEAKETADKALKQYHELNSAVSNLTGKLEALESRNVDLEQHYAGQGRGGAGVVSVGQEIANSDDLKNYIERGAQGGLTLRPTNAITTVSGATGGLIVPDQDRQVTNMPMQRLAVRSLLSQATTESDLVKYARQTVRTSGAAPTAEGGTMPELVVKWSAEEAAVRKIAAIVHASDEALADAGQLQALIDQELRYDLDLEEEAQIIAGDGQGQNLTGLTSVAASFVAPAGLPNETRIDRLRLGLLQIALSNYAADGVTINPVDWAGIELLKDAQKRYIFGNPNELATPRLWGLDVVPTLSHSVGEWMVGAFRMAATIYDRQENEVLISSEHGNNFVEGMKTIRGTKRLALAHKRPGALVTGDFTFAP